MVKTISVWHIISRIIKLFQYCVKFELNYFRYKMNIVVDENIALVKEALSQFGNVRLINGRDITDKSIDNADVLIVRSITKINAELLKNSKVKFVGTATIGTDHIDLEYLKSKNIAFTYAQGCNADSVAEYVFTALLKISTNEKISLNKKTIGVVGIGNIGSRVVKIAEAFGLNVLKNDPPLEKKGIGNHYSSLNEILQADIITLHVPLNRGDMDKTYHLLNEQNLSRIKEGAILINTARGAVIDNDALLKTLWRKKIYTVLDVWENEPAVNTKLLNIIEIGTAHIAGYSLEGKINGTKMIYRALCKFFQQKPGWIPLLPNIINCEKIVKDKKSSELNLYELISSIYNIEEDDRKMRNIIKLKTEDQSKYFDQLRKEYPLRREFSNYTVHLGNDEHHLEKILRALGFNLK